MLWVVLAIVGVLLVGHFVSAMLLADAFTRARRRRVEGTPADLGLRYDEVQFTTTDGIAILGWWMESPGARATVVLVHDVEGTRSDRSHGLPAIQRDYLQRGMNVLAFDLRGRGESGGMRDTFGDRERADVAAAVAFARRRQPDLPVILHGFGLGGSLAITGAADGLNVQLVIADSPFASARAYLRQRWAAVPWPTFALACRLARRRFGADADALRPLAAACDASRVPILFIHGDADRLVPVTHTLNIAAAALNPNSRVWRVSGAGHCASYRRAPDAYMRRCMDFIDAAVPRRRITIAVAG